VEVALRGAVMNMYRVMLGMAIVFGATGMAVGGEIGFLENFALARDRTAPLRQLIPGTEDYYYFHALHFLNMAKEATAWPVKDVQAGSMLDAMRTGNFLYVYLSTQAESTFGVGDHILHMGRADSERFLSFFKSYYMLHRSSSSSAEAEAARDEKMR
jgi:hypothetical protein